MLSASLNKKCLSFLHLSSNLDSAGSNRKSLVTIIVMYNKYRNSAALSIRLTGARCSSVVRAFAHGTMGRRIDPSWWTHWAISRSNQCSTAGVTKAVVCAILSAGWCI